MLALNGTNRLCWNFMKDYHNSKLHKITMEFDKRIQKGHNNHIHVDFDLASRNGDGVTQATRPPQKEKIMYLCITIRGQICRRLLNRLIRGRRERDMLVRAVITKFKKRRRRKKLFE